MVWGCLIGTYLLWGRWSQLGWQRRVGLLIVMSLAGGPVQEAYLVLANFTIIVYFIPYLYLFASLVRLAIGAPPPGSIPRMSTPMWFVTRRYSSANSALWLQELASGVNRFVHE